MFKSLSLRVKLIAAFIFIASLVAGATIYQMQTITSSNALLDDVVTNDIERLKTVEEMRSIVDEVYHSTLVNRYIESAPITEAALEGFQKKLSEEQQKYRSFLKGDDEATESLQMLENIKSASDTLLQQAIELSALSSSAKASVLDTKEQAFTAQQELVSQQIKDLLEVEQQVIREEKRQADAQFATAQREALMVAGLPVLAALALGFLVSGILVRRLNKIKDSAQHIANGDFSHTMEVSIHDEIGAVTTTINQMSDRLRDSYRRIALEKQRDEALIENMSEGVIAIDAENKVALINSVATELLALPSRQEVVGAPLAGKRPLYSADGKPLKPEEYPGRTALYTSKPVSGVYMFHPQDDKSTLLNISANPVIVNDKTLGVVILARDVTKEKEVDRMKREFISLASHQLRTPLSAIKWYTEMLLSGDAGKLSPDQNEFAQSVYDSSERMIDLVNSLLNISRIESGRIIVDPKPTDLKELVSGIVTDLKGKTEEKQQTLVISVHKDLPKINLDPRLVGQVFMNLLTNAIKYTPKGGEISVFVSKKDDQVLAQVTDNGYGIPKSQHDKVFQKFFRAENIVKVETDGTGLGLYLIKAIIESSGGKIWFESEEGKGTTFWFTLPLSGMKAKEGEVTLDA